MPGPVSGPFSKGPIEPSKGPQLDLPLPGKLPETSKQPKLDPKQTEQMRQQLLDHATAGSTLKAVLTTCRGNSGAARAVFSTTNSHVLEPRMKKEEQAQLDLLAALAIGQAVSQQFPPQ